MPGYRDCEASTRSWASTPPSLTRARALANGSTRDGKAVLYTFNNSPGPEIAQVVQFNLQARSGSTSRSGQYDRVVQHEKAATRGEPFDITIEGWGADYADPYNFLNVLLDGTRIQKRRTTSTTSYFNEPATTRGWSRPRACPATPATPGVRASSTRDITRDRRAARRRSSTRTRSILVSEEIGCYTYSDRGRQHEPRRRLQEVAADTLGEPPGSAARAPPWLACPGRSLPLRPAEIVFSHGSAGRPRSTTSRLTIPPGRGLLSSPAPSGGCKNDLR